MDDMRKLKESIDANRSSLISIMVLLICTLLAISFGNSAIKDKLNAQARKIDRLEDALNEQARTLDNIYRQCHQSSP